MTVSKIDFPPATTAVSGAGGLVLTSATAKSELKEEGLALESSPVVLGLKGSYMSRLLRRITVRIRRISRSIFEALADLKRLCLLVKRGSS